MFDKILKATPDKFFNLMHNDFDDEENAITFYEFLFATGYFKYSQFADFYEKSPSPALKKMVRIDGRLIR